VGAGDPVVFDTDDYSSGSSINRGIGGSFNLLNNDVLGVNEPALYYVQYSANAVSAAGEGMELSLLLNGTPIEASQAISTIPAAPNVVAGGSIFPTDIAENPNTLTLNNTGAGDLTSVDAMISIIKLI
jgi:hypothetical protein